MERKLTAILCADVFGYSRLMGENEEATLRTLTSYRKLIDGLIQHHRGRFVNSAGDSVVAEFASVVDAVQCAVVIQTTPTVGSLRSQHQQPLGGDGNTQGPRNRGAREAAEAFPHPLMRHDLSQRVDMLRCR